MANIVSGGKPFASSHQNASHIEAKAFTGLQGQRWNECCLWLKIVDGSELSIFSLSLTQQKGS